MSDLGSIAICRDCVVELRDGLQRWVARIESPSQVVDVIRKRA